MALKGTQIQEQESSGGQLKTAVDRAAEGWVLGYLRALFPQDLFLCEEFFDQSSTNWDASETYWTIDALDGTRSYVEGFTGFCVQLAFIEDGRVQLGVVYEPVRQVTYWALLNQGAFMEDSEGHRRRLLLLPVDGWPDCPVFVDSTPPSGIVGEVLQQFSGKFLECGSIGLKLCRVADGSADVFAKELGFKLWDVAPAQLIISEAGGRMGLWAGEMIPFHTSQVYFDNLVAAPSGLFGMVVKELGRFHSREGTIAS